MRVLNSIRRTLAHTDEVAVDNGNQYRVRPLLLRQVDL